VGNDPIHQKGGFIMSLKLKLPANDVYVGDNQIVLGSDGSLYQKGVKITATAANINALSTDLITPKIADGDTGITIASADQTHAAPTATIPNIGDAADTFVMADTEQTLTLKTLTAPIIATIYQDAGKTKLMTLPNVASDTLAAVAASQTLTNKTLTAPVLTNPATTVTLSPHDYGAAANDWTLSAAELLMPVHKPTNASGAVNAIISHSICRPYIFINATGYTLTVKGSSGTTIAIANNKVATVMSDGTNVIRITADA
jgi:hypothetical protein